MMGTEDPIVPLVNGRILAHLIPDAHLVTVDDGHLFLIARTEEVAPVIRDFLMRPAKHSVDRHDKPGALRGRGGSLHPRI